MVLSLEYRKEILMRIDLMMVVSLAAVLLWGCGKKEEETPAEGIEGSVSDAAKVVEAELIEIEEDARAEVEAKLAAADKLDGATDKVVHRCPACKLGMDGSEKYALRTAGYTLHFC
jgi:hypothetical protein